MARSQRRICVLLCLCMIGGFIVYSPFLLWLSSLDGGGYGFTEKVLPFFAYQRSVQDDIWKIEDEATYQAIVEANRDYLKKQVEGENAKESEEGEEALTPTPEPQNEEATTLAAGRKPIQEITREQLDNYDYLLNNFFIVDGGTTTSSEQINASGLLDRDMTLVQKEEPQILIYHSHSQEGFSDSVSGDTSTTVVGVGDRLTDILKNQYGYNVIHVTDAFDVVNGEIDRNSAYDYAREKVEQVLAENPSIEVVIDLHRDGVPESRRLVTQIDGKPTAQIMFFNGLSYSAMNGSIDYLPNPHIAENLAFSFQLELASKEYFGDFTRAIYLSSLRYNLHLKPRAILLEVGAQNNTVEEAKNAMDPFAWILNKVLKGE